MKICSLKQFRFKIGSVVSGKFEKHRYAMNTITSGFKWFSKIFALVGSIIGRVILYRTVWRFAPPCLYIRRSAIIRKYSKSHLHLIHQLLLRFQPSGPCSKIVRRSADVEADISTKYTITHGPFKQHQLS